MRGVLYSLGAALLGCATLWHATDGLRAVTAEGARRVSVARDPRPLPAVSIQTMQSDWVTIAESGPALVEFIYTTCPTICQISGGDFAELRDHLTDAGHHIPMYSVSFDPENDDLEALLTYAELHSATGDPWTVARPRKADVAALLKAFDVTIIPDIWGGYEHNIAVLFINEEGRFAGAFDTRAFDQIQAAVEGAS